MSATVKDQAGASVSSATIKWESLDTAVVVVTSGKLQSVRSGQARVRTTASLGSATPGTRELVVNVARQRNTACRTPMTTTRGAVSGVPAFGTTVEILSSLPGAGFDGSRTLPADFDGDGDVDAVRIEYSFPSSNPYSGTTRIFRNDAGTLVDATSQVLAAPVIPDHARDFEIRDLTGDGIADIYVAQHGLDAAPFPGAANLLLAKSGSQLANVAPTSFSPYVTTSFSHASAAGDVDCDGDVDMVELNLTASAPNYLWVNAGNGRFITAPTSAFPIGTISQAASQKWQEAEFIDFDDDGDPDLFLGARSGPNWNVDILMVNDGFGRFREAVGVRLPSPKYSPNHAINNVKAADFNGDGLQDLVMFEIPQPFSTSSAIRLWTNLGNGTFRDDSQAWKLPATCTGEVVEPLFVADFNKDGWPDVVVPTGCSELGGTGILFNAGTSFTSFASRTIQPWLASSIITPLDIDKDGDPDLLFSDGRGRNNPPVLVRNPR